MLDNPRQIVNFLGGNEEFLCVQSILGTESGFFPRSFPFLLSSVEKKVAKIRSSQAESWN